MTRFALALAAILLVALSAGYTHVQLQQAAANSGLVAGQVRGQGRLLAGDASLLMGQPPASQTPPLLAAPPAAEGPAPALLVYVALVLVGSLVAVVLVRRNQRI